MADIVIRGMEMPTQCGNCPISTNTRRCTILWREFGDPSKRLEDCPLVPLPEGHGRLVDADALEREICDAIYNYWNGGDNGYYLAEDALPDIRFAPAIVPAEGD